MLQNNIYKYSIYYVKIYNDFLNIFNIVENVKKMCGHLDLLFRQIAKVGITVKIATFS